MVSNRFATFALGILPYIRKWRMAGDLSHLDKSLMIVAPHTSYMDAVVGKYILARGGYNHRMLTKSELFRWPFKRLLLYFGYVPVGGVKGQNSINEVVKEFKKHDKVHIVICPEGQLAVTTKWNPGFIYMAQKAQVPIVVLGLDYKRRESVVLDIIEDVSDARGIMRRLPELYKDITACHPDMFALPEVK